MIIKNIFENNKAWVAKRLEQDPNYFENLSRGQNPEILWIGCSDSRVPPNEITRTKPGEIFIHRNIANMAIHSDMNMLSVLDYAVNALKVKHVVVCGHYECGGVKAAMGRKQNGLVDNWIRHIKDVYRLYEHDLESIKDEHERFDKFVELNVREQVFDLSRTSIIQNAWQNRNEPKLHGFVFDIKTGFLKDLGVHFDSKCQLPEFYRIESDIVKD